MFHVCSILALLHGFPIVLVDLYIFMTNTCTIARNKTSYSEFRIWVLVLPSTPFLPVSISSLLSLIESYLYISQLPFICSIAPHHLTTRHSCLGYRVTAQSRQNRRRWKTSAASSAFTQQVRILRGSSSTWLYVFRLQMKNLLSL